MSCNRAAGERGDEPYYGPVHATTCDEVQYRGPVRAPRRSQRGLPPYDEQDRVRGANKGGNMGLSLMSTRVHTLKRWLVGGWDLIRKVTNHCRKHCFAYPKAVVEPSWQKSLAVWVRRGRIGTCPTPLTDGLKPLAMSCSIACFSFPEKLRRNCFRPLNRVLTCMKKAYKPRGSKQPGAEMLRSLRVPRGVYREEKPPPAKARVRGY